MHNFPVACLLGLLAQLSIASDGILASFNHGVASGDPLPNAIIIWTRVSPHLESTTFLEVVWEVFDHTGAIAQTGVQSTNASKDWTIKVDVSGLPSSTPHTYRFRCGASTSPTGAFKLPPPHTTHLTKLNFAVFSCSNWGWGHFNAYHHAFAQQTEQDPLDFWLHLGDFIYEYGEDRYPAPTEAVRFGSLQPKTEIVTLQDYRLRYALARTDPSLQALSQAAPVIAVYDDHEISNDAYANSEDSGGAQNHNPATEGDFVERKTAALQAYHEWMPIRSFQPNSAPPEARTFIGPRIYRNFQFGDLVSLMMLESRLVNRTKQPDNSWATSAVSQLVKDHPPSEWDTEQVSSTLQQIRDRLNEERFNTTRTILGATQLEWIESQTQQSVANGVTWQMYGQQIVVQDLLPPDFDDAIAQQHDPATAAMWQEILRNLTGSQDDSTFCHDSSVAYRAASRGVPQSVNNPWLGSSLVRQMARELYVAGKFKLATEVDSWVAYAAERERFLHSIRNARNPVVFAGDSHNSWAGLLSSSTLDEPVVATEFDTTSVTSPGFTEYAGFFPVSFFEAAMLSANKPSLKFLDVQNNGYLQVSVTHREQIVRFMTVDIVPAPAIPANGLGSAWYDSDCRAAFRVANAQRSMEEVDCSVKARTNDGDDDVDHDSGIPRSLIVVSVVCSVGCVVMLVWLLSWWKDGYGLVYSLRVPKHAPIAEKAHANDPGLQLLRESQAAVE